MSGYIQQGNTHARVPARRVDERERERERDTFAMHSVNKRHLSPSIALHFVFYALRSPGRFMLRFMLHTERAHRGIDARSHVCIIAAARRTAFSLCPANRIALPCRARSLSLRFLSPAHWLKRDFFTARKIGWFSVDFSRGTFAPSLNRDTPFRIYSRNYSLSFSLFNVPTYSRERARLMAYVRFFRSNARSAPVSTSPTTLLPRPSND